MRKAAHVLLRESVAGYARRGESEVSKHGARSCLVGRDIRHTDRAFLLVRPGMSSKIIIERLILTVEKFDLVRLFETADEYGHSASHGAKKGFRRMGGFSRSKSGEAFKFPRGPRNLDTRKREFRRDAFEPREHEFLPLAPFSLAEDSTTTSSFPYRPVEQGHSVREEIRVAVKLQLLFQDAYQPVLGRSQISLKLGLA